MSDLHWNVTVSEAAKRISISVKELYRMEAAGRIRFVRFGRATRVPMCEVARLTQPVEGRVEGLAATPENKTELFPRLTA